MTAMLLRNGAHKNELIQEGCFLVCLITLKDVGGRSLYKISELNRPAAGLMWEVQGDMMIEATRKKVDTGKKKLSGTENLL